MPAPVRFSALQRAEIAEMQQGPWRTRSHLYVSVLFNEPKLLKSAARTARRAVCTQRFSALQRAEIAEISKTIWRGQIERIGFSALQRAEIAEITAASPCRFWSASRFQCSSTSRNC